MPALSDSALTADFRLLQPTYSLGVLRVHFRANRGTFVSQGTAVLIQVRGRPLLATPVPSLSLLHALLVPRVHSALIDVRCLCVMSAV